MPSSAPTGSSRAAHPPSCWPPTSRRWPRTCAWACQLPVAGLHVDAVRGARRPGPGGRLAAGAQGSVGRHRRWPQHLADRPGCCTGHAARRAGQAPRRAVAGALVLAAARPREPGRRATAGPGAAHPGSPSPPREAGRTAHAAGRAGWQRGDRRKRVGRGARGRRSAPRQHPRAPRRRGPAPGAQHAGRRPAPVRLSPAPAGAAAPVGAAAVADHHHRLVPADDGDPRRARAAFKRGAIDAPAYEAAMREEIALAVRKQEALGLDVLVHGEAERNDMVEYFGEQLDGFGFTTNGWVQSYGSRCVKPPILYGDVARPAPMTVDWTTYAQSLTRKPMKGMLTGPVNPPAMVLRARRPAACAELRADRLGHPRRSGRPGARRHRHRADRRAGHPRRIAAAPRRVEGLPGRGHTRLSHQRLGCARRHADPHPHVLRRVQRHPARDRARWMPM